MKKIEQLNNSKVPVIVFDKKLEQFRNKILFPEKIQVVILIFSIFS